MKRVIASLLVAITAYGQGSQTPIYNGLLQSDLNAAGFKILTADLSDYAGTGLTWNVATNKFEASGGGGGSGTVTSITATSPIVATPATITTTGSIALDPFIQYNWDTAYSDRLKWDGGATGLTAATGRTSLGLVIGTNVEAWLGNPSTNGYVLSSTTAGVRSWIAPSAGGGTPGGSTTEVQFNDGGAFGGDSAFTWNKTTDILTLTSSQLGLGVSNGPWSIGNSSSATTAGSLALGYAATATLQSLCIGYAAGASGGTNASTLLGFNAQGAANSVVVGSSASAGINSFALGSGANASGVGSVAMGYNTLAPVGNIFVSGADLVPINNVYFGKGYVNAAPSAYAINGTGGSGTDIAGGGLTLAGGRGTGTGVGGSILFQTAAAGSTGASLNALATKLTISPSATTFASGSTVDFTGATVTGLGAGGAVSSVFTRTGAVVAASGDYAAFYQPLDTDLTTYAGVTPTTVGLNFIDLANPSAITFPKITAGNDVVAENAATFRTSIGAAGGTGTANGTNTGDQTSIVGITGTLTEFNTALTGADFATGGGTATGTNTGDQTLVGLGGQPLDTDLTAIAGITGVRGDVLFYGASGWARLGVGTNGNQLTTHAAGADPTWDAPGAGGGSGDVVGPVSSVASEIALFDGLTGKLIKSATGSGLVTATSGVYGTTTNNTANWDTAYTNNLRWDGGSTSLVAATGRTSLALNNVTNDAQTQAAIVPNTAPSTGQILVGNAGGTAYAKQTVSGSGATITMGATGVITISAIANASLSDADLTTWAGITPGTNVGTFLATPSSANLRAALTDENGTGAALFSGATAPDFTTGFTIGAAAASGKILVGNGTNYVPSTPTFPATSSATSRKFIVSDGTNWVASTETQAVPGTSGNLLTSDGTNWLSSAPVVSATSTTTFTNKRINPRVVASATGNTTPTPDVSTTDQYNVIGMTVNMVFGAPTGTPVDGQRLIIRIEDSGSVRTIGWNAAYRIVGVTLPTTTVASKLIYVGCIYNSTDSVWDVIAVVQEA